MNQSDHPPAVGWHADGNDPLTSRYWNGTEWTSQRHWNGREWLDSSAEPESVIATGSESTSSDDLVAKIRAAVSESSRTFKVFVGAVFATVLGFFVPVATVTTGGDFYSYTETRSLGDAGGFGVLVVGAAAATLWFAWPSRRGVVSTGGLWGIGAMAGVIGLFTVALIVAANAPAEDQGIAIDDIVVYEQTVAPSLGLFLLLAAVVAQTVGIYLAHRDRSRVYP